MCGDQMRPRLNGCDCSDTAPIRAANSGECVCGLKGKVWATLRAASRGPWAMARGKLCVVEGRDEPEKRSL